MQRVWPIIAVTNVGTSAAWYEHLLNGDRTHPDSTVFSQVLSDDGEVLVCVHHCGPSGPGGNHHWASISNTLPQHCGGGLLLWFVVDDFEEAWARARALNARIEEEPNIDNDTGARAFVIRDPDGYCVAVNDSAVATASG